MVTTLPPDATAAGTFRIGGDLEVHRLGFGAMRITGEGIWGPPADRDEALRVLRRAVELGIDFIDTADSYGPYVSEELIAEALHPYPEGLVIATKGGLERPGPGKWAVERPAPSTCGRRAKGACERLRLERIDLYQLHRIDPEVPAEDQFGTLVELQREGKIRHIGLSEVGVDEIRQARRALPGRHGAEPLQPGRPAVGGGARLLHRARASASSPGSRCRPASSRSDESLVVGSPSSTTPRRRRWRSPGCCRARR